MVGILKRIFIIFLFCSSFIIDVGESEEVYVKNNESFLKDNSILNNTGNLNKEIEENSDSKQ